MNRFRSRTSSARYSVDRSSHSHRSGPEHVFEFNDRLLNEDLEKVVQAMNKNSSSNTVIHILQSIFMELPKSWTVTQWISRWVDSRGLDLLNCAIVNDKPNIVQYLLKEAKLFPEAYFPKLNPYAHVAATVGSVRCLETLLSFRPDDYFEGSHPSHRVKLPHDVLKRLGLSCSNGMADRKLNKIVQNVKGAHKIAERATVKSNAGSIFEFEEEIKKFEASLQRCGRQQKKRFIYPNAFSEQSKRISKTQQVGGKMPEGQKVELPIPRKKPLKRSRVTVYMDVFKDGRLDRAKDSCFADEPSTSMCNRRCPPILTSTENNCTKLQIDHSVKHSFDFDSQRKTSEKSQDSHSFQEQSSISSHSKQLRRTTEIGIPKFKKYKEFLPTFEHRHSHAEVYVGKTPLILAAEQNQHDCVHFLLKKYHLHKINSLQQKGDLCLAVIARIPEVIAVILQRSVSITEYQNAVMLAIRELYPDSLNILLTLGAKHRREAFGGVNLFHILYSQSLQIHYGYEILPEMTRVIISSQEDVNSRQIHSTYPLYTLIQSAFNVNMGRHSLYFLKCLEILLQAKANPHFDETKQRGKVIANKRSTSVGRLPYTSAIQCVLLNANTSFEHFEVRYWSQIIMQRFIESIELHDKSPRRVNNDVLFLYLSYVRKLGLNQRVLRALLRIGANPDHVKDGQYALNVYFEEMLRFLTKFKVKKMGLLSTENTLHSLLYLCRAMSPHCLQQSVVHFLDNHLLVTPLQALELTRIFCYHANKMIMSPRTLTHITSHAIWLACNRNAEGVRALPVPEDVIQMILP